MVGSLGLRLKGKAEGRPSAMAIRNWPNFARAERGGSNAARPLVPGGILHRHCQDAGGAGGVGSSLGPSGVT